MENFLGENNSSSPNVWPIFILPLYGMESLSLVSRDFFYCIFADEIRDAQLHILFNLRKKCNGKNIMGIKSHDST